MTARGKNLAGLLAGAAAAGALGLYAYFGVAKPGEREADRKAVEEKLVTLAAPGEKAPDGGEPPAPVFTSITVSAKGDTTRLERRGEGWFLTSPVEAKADAMAAEQLVSQLGTGRIKDKVEEKATDEDLKRYGLLPPKFVIKATAHAGDPSKARELVLEGGIENTFDGSIYLHRPGDPAVYSAAGAIRYGLEKGTFDLRDKQLFALDEGKATKLEVKKGGAVAYSVERDGLTWKMTRPLAMTADKQAITDMLTSLKAERATAFPKDAPEERKRLKLDAPQLDVTLTFSEGAPMHLLLSKADGKAGVVREQGGTAVLAEVPAAVVDHLDKAAGDLRDKLALQFDRDQVARLVFRPAGGGAPIDVQKVAADAGTAGDWQVTSPERGPAMKWKLSSLLWTLSGLRASALDEENPSWSKYGIGDKSRAVQLYGKDGKLLAELKIGNEVKGKPNTAYARGTRTMLLELDTTRFGELPEKADDIIARPPPAASDGGFPELSLPPD